MKTLILASLISSQALAANVFECTVKQIVNNPEKMTGGKVKDCGSFTFDSSLDTPKDQSFDSCSEIILSYTPHAVRHGLKALVIGSRSDVNGGSAFVVKNFPDNFVFEFSRSKSEERESYEVDCSTN